jgi:NAD(P)-dependent dehydrogenase (short-subunit alcohol dehydrogenase family)
MNEFKNKKVLITGAGKGIGKACAVRFASGGAVVVLNYLSSEKDARETAVLVKHAGGKAILAQGDMGRDEDVAGLWKEANADGNPPVVLVLNAAYQKKCTFEETTPELLRGTFNVNIVGNFQLAKLFVDQCRERGIDGRIVIHSSNQGEFVNPTGFGYALSKAALNHMVRHIARAVAADGIRVNGVILGWFDTEGERTFYSSEQIREQAAKTIPVKRAGDPAEAANLTYFLASDASSYMTGSLVRYDGGFSLDPDLST